MFWVKEDVLTLTFRLLYLPYKCHVLFDRGHPITIICIIFIFLFFVFVLFLWFILILYIFIVFLIWRGMCVCVCVHAHVWGERKTQIQVGLLEVFLNLCPSTFLLGHKQEAPDAGQRDCFSLSHPLTSGRHHSALPTPGHTQASLGGFWSHRRLQWPPGLSFVPPDPFSICAVREGLCINTVSPSVTLGHSFHTHLIQVRGEQGQLCVLFCLSFKLPDLFYWPILLKLSRLLL